MKDVNILNDQIDKILFLNKNILKKVSNIYDYDNNISARGLSDLLFLSSDLFKYYFVINKNDVNVIDLLITTDDLYVLTNNDFLLKKDLFKKYAKNNKLIIKQVTSTHYKHYLNNGEIIESNFFFEDLSVIDKLMENNSENELTDLMNTIKKACFLHDFGNTKNVKFLTNFSELNMKFDTNELNCQDQLALYFSYKNESFYINAFSRCDFEYTIQSFKNITNKYKSTRSLSTLSNF